MLTNEREPLTYKEAKACEHSNKWELAMQEEIKALHSNNTWDLIKLPKGRKGVPNKWVYKIKTGCKRICSNYGKNDHFVSAICYSGCT